MPSVMRFLNMKMQGINLINLFVPKADQKEK